MILGNIFGFGNPMELGIIAVVVLVLFGGTRIAGFSKSLGEGMREFKKAIHEEPESKEAAPAAKTTVSEAPAAPEATKKVD
jgi:sec-independent protein translocase protein TatA